MVRPDHILTQGHVARALPPGRTFRLVSCEGRRSPGGRPAAARKHRRPRAPIPSKQGPGASNPGAPPRSSCVGSPPGARRRLPHPSLRRYRQGQGPDSPSQTPSPATTTSGPTRSLGSAGSMPAGGDAKRACFYGSVSVMQHVGHQVGQTFDCALVFNDATPNWTGWEHPWFIGYYKPDFNWSAWATAVPGRQLVITQRMIPDNPPSDWRQRGANGEYDAHAAELARTLVAAGLGNS